MTANRIFLGVLFIALLPLSAEESPSSSLPSFGSTLDTGRHVYENVEVIGIRGSNLFFRHSRGLASLPISKLPPQVRVQLEDRIAAEEPPPEPAQPADPTPANPNRETAGEEAGPGKGSAVVPVRVARKPATVFLVIRRQHPSPLGTGTYRGPRGLPLNWFVVHPAVYPQSLANPEWRRLAELDFRITAARNNPALITRNIVSGW